MACSPDKMRAALFEQAENITEFVNDRIRESDRLALRMVKDMGYIEPHKNTDVVMYGTAKQAPLAYKEVDNTIKPLVDGDMNGAGLDRSNQIFPVDINDLPDNACHGSCILDFSQGFRRRGSRDFELKVTSREICTAEFNRLQRDQARGYFRSFKTNFSRWGFDNFSDNLLNQLIRHSEANTSIIAANQFNLTTGGFQAPPTGRLSIWHIQRWKEAIGYAMYTAGLTVPMDWNFEIEAPVEDWIDAVRQDQLVLNPTGTQYIIKYLEDAEGPMRKRKFDVYGGIKCYFNEHPIRGYFKQTGVSAGQPTYNFTRIFDWKNEAAEVGGLVVVANPDYNNPEITIGGATYPVVTLIPHIDPRSFKRWGLEKPAKPIGEANMGTNFEVKVLDGPYIDCNDHNDKFKLAARHYYRFGSRYPEISGFCAYRHSRRAGYLINPTVPVLVPGTTNFAGPEVLPTCNPDPCSAIECAQCDQVPNENLQCVPVDVAPFGTLNLTPCGVVNVDQFGTPFSLTLKVYRTGDPSSASSVNYATANGSAISGTEYTATSGTLNWAAGDSQPKDIVVPILGSGDGTFTVTISSATGGDTLGTCTVATVTISDET